MELKSSMKDAISGSCGLALTIALAPISHGRAGRDATCTGWGQELALLPGGLSITVHVQSEPERVN